MVTIRGFYPFFLCFCTCMRVLPRIITLRPQISVCVSRLSLISLLALETSPTTKPSALLSSPFISRWKFNELPILSQILWPRKAYKIHLRFDWPLSRGISGDLSLVMTRLHAISLTNQELGLLQRFPQVLVKPYLLSRRRPEVQLRGWPTGSQLVQIDRMDGV